MVKEAYKIFVGGLAGDISERQLERAFDRFGKIIECQWSLNIDAYFTESDYFKLMWKRCDGYKNLFPSQQRKHIIIACGLLTFRKQNYRDIATFAGPWMQDRSIMLDRDSGRPRGFGFITYADRRGMDDAIREMHGREFGDRIISVNKALPRGDEIDPPSYRGGYSSGGRAGSFARDGPGAQDECFKCGRLGHWARDCPSAGGGRGVGGPPLSSHSRYGGPGDRFGGERDRYFEDRYDGGRYGDRDRFDSRDIKYAGRDRNVGDRYPPPAGDRFPSDRYGGSDRYPINGFGKERGFDRDPLPRGGGDRYGSGGPVRADDRSYRNRVGPYDRPPPRGGRGSSFERY